MSQYIKYIRDIIFIILLFRLTYIENNNIWLLVELITSMSYFFIPTDISNKNNFNYLQEVQEYLIYLNKFL